MPNFFVPERKLYGLLKPARATGTVETSVLIQIRGNHKRGPVPVNVKYSWTFYPDEEYWEQDSEHPGDPFSWTTFGHFDSKEERDMYLSNFFEARENGQVGHMIGKPPPR